MSQCPLDGVLPPRSAILWLPGGAFLLRVPTCPIFAQRIWSALLAAELPRLPGILELRYTLPADADTTLVQVQDALRYLRNEGYEKVILAGDSAGGYLSLRALLEGSEGVVGALAICPWLDLALSAPSLQRNRSFCFLSPSWLQVGRERFLQRLSSSPSKGLELARKFSLTQLTELQRLKLSKLQQTGGSSPVLLVAGELDALCDDASALAAVSPGLVQSVEVAGFHDALLLPLLGHPSHALAYEKMAIWALKLLR
ncbi:unnamed protein product [Durusdinium trenchii]|uniref:Alpha/beta hydrolase fold-3 domain-containing protein n=1 Tax=Durusdinium trenchii TaxID=1381693 RepID=A0ABP0Q4G0_9DINO